MTPAFSFAALLLCIAAWGQVTQSADPTGELDRKAVAVPADQVLSVVAAARKAIHEHPDSAQAYLDLGIALRSGGDRQGAFEAINKALTLDSSLADAWLQKGLILIDGGGTLKAATVYFQKAVEGNPQSVPARIELSAMLFRSGDFPGARAQIEAVLRLEPNNAGALGGLGFLELQQGELPAAIENFRKAMALRAHYPEAEQNLGNALMRRGDWAGAKKAFEQALKDEPDTIPAVYGLATVLRHLGDPAEAQKNYAKAKSMLGMTQALARAQADDNNGVRLWNAGDLAGAAASFRSAIADHPSYAEAHNNLGGVLWQQNNPKEATREFVFAVRADPNFTKAHNNLGNALMAAGDLQGAIEHFRKAISLEPGFATGHFSLGMALSQQGQRDQAESEFRRALILSPDLAVAHLELGLLLASRASSLSPEARTEIEDGIRLDPHLRAALPPNVAKALSASSESAIPFH